MGPIVAAVAVSVAVVVAVDVSVVGVSVAVVVAVAVDKRRLQLANEVGKVAFLVVSHELEGGGRLP